MERPPVTLDCNECNEALAEALTALAAAQRLALVAENALADGDLRRTQAAMRTIHDASAGEIGSTSSARRLRTR